MYYARTFIMRSRSDDVVSSAPNPTDREQWVPRQLTCACDSFFRRFGYGLSYTTFAISNATIMPASAPALVNGTALANVTVKVQVDVTNTGSMDASVPIMLTYAKETRLVIRYLRMLAGFTKVYVPAGQTVTASIVVSMKDLARYDTEIQWNDLLGNPVQGAYVVDGGDYTFFIGDCVSVGPVWDDRDTCPKSRQASLPYTIGEDGETAVYL